MIPNNDSQTFVLHEEDFTVSRGGGGFAIRSFVAAPIVAWKPVSDCPDVLEPVSGYESILGAHAGIVVRNGIFRSHDKHWYSIEEFLRDVSEESPCQGMALYEDAHGTVWAMRDFEKVHKFTDPEDWAHINGFFEG